MARETRFQKGSGLVELVDGTTLLIILGMACLQRSRAVRILQAMVPPSQAAAGSISGKPNSATEITEGGHGDGVE